MAATTSNHRVKLFREGNPRSYHPNSNDWTPRKLSQKHHQDAKSNDISRLWSFQKQKRQETKLSFHPIHPPTTCSCLSLPSGHDLGNKSQRPSKSRLGVVIRGHATDHLRLLKMRWISGGQIEARIFKARLRWVNYKVANYSRWRDDIYILYIYINTVPRSL